MLYVIRSKLSCVEDAVDGSKYAVEININTREDRLVPPHGFEFLLAAQLDFKPERSKIDGDQRSLSGKRINASLSIPSKDESTSSS